MASALERSFEELVENSLGCIVVYEASGQHKHIGIVVLAYQMGNLWNPRQSGTYALMLVERHAYAFAAAADSYAGINFAALHALGQSMAEVGIIAAKVAVCAIVLVGVAVALQILQDELLQREACVVASYSYCLYVHCRAY